MAFWFIAAIFVGLLIDFVISRHFRKPYRPAALLLSVCTCILLLKTFTSQLDVLKGFLLSEALICAGICDGLSHEIPDFLMVPMIASGFIEFKPIPSIEGFFSVSLLFYIMARFTNGKAIGGGDIKLTAAAGFALGISGIVGGTILGTALFLMAYPALRFKGEKQCYAMSPWLGTGCFFAYLLIPIGGIY